MKKAVLVVLAIVALGAGAHVSAHPHKHHRHHHRHHHDVHHHGYSGYSHGYHHKRHHGYYGDYPARVHREARTYRVVRDDYDRHYGRPGVQGYIRINAH